MQHLDQFDDRMHPEQPAVPRPHHRGLIVAAVVAVVAAAGFAAVVVFSAGDAGAPVPLSAATTTPGIEFVACSSADDALEEAYGAWSVNAGWKMSPPLGVGFAITSVEQLEFAAQTALSADSDPGAGDAQIVLVSARRLDSDLGQVATAGHLPSYTDSDVSGLDKAMGPFARCS